MKHIIIATIVLVFVIITSCSETEFTKEELEQIVCTADVYECPDGSFVGRDPMNNCEFKECSDNPIIQSEPLVL